MRDWAIWQGSKPQAKLLRPVVAGVLFSLGFVLSRFWLPAIPVLDGSPAAVQWMPVHEAPGEDSFFTYSSADERSHLALFHDFGESISNARNADILFLGNSRMPLGLREDVIVPAAESAGVSVFSLATGHGEPVGFGLDVIRRNDLRPKVVVAVGGPEFYGRFYSPRAESVAALDRWQAWKEWSESGWRWAFERRIHSWVPRLDWFGSPLTTDWIIYRSPATGWWRPAREPRGRRPVRFVEERPSYRATLPAARRLADEIRDRGATLVLTLVPNGRTRSGHLPYLSRELGVPAVLPDVGELFTSDGSHLRADSGRRYARAFWEDLLSIAEVRRRLGVEDVAVSGGRDKAIDTTAVRTAVLEMRSMLEEYYGGPQILRATWYLDADDSRYRAGTEYLAEKLARALVWRDRFVIGTIGSSVVAGFDNCHYDTYQKQLERLMEPVWKSAGVAFEVRNSGQGGDCGDDFKNQVWCLRSLVGDDVDMTQYSWTYFEAGHSPEELQLHHELFYRWSLLMERRPVPQLIYTHDCARLSKEDVALLDRYGEYGANVLCMERGIRAAGYPGKKWGVVGDTIHDTTRYGESADVGEERRRSLGVVFRNWHPGPLLFQTTADAIAYNLSDALLRAIELIEAEPYPSVRWPRRPRSTGAAFLPDPLACPPEWCRDEVPRCTVYEKPTFGLDFFERVLDDEQAAGQAETVDGEWVLWDAGPRPAYMPKSERKLPECAHPARCRGWRAPPSQQPGPLVFDLPDLRLGRVAVCCSRKSCGRIMLEAGATFTLNGQPPAEPARVVRRGKCVEVQSQFGKGAKPGKVRLRIHIPTRADPIPAITHIIGL